jgi:two-component system OmpR family sensor kinase
MTLRSRLIAAFTAIVLVVIALVGAIAVRSTSRVLLGQVDQRLMTASRADIFSALGGEERPVGRTLAVMIIDPDGTVARAIPSGNPGNFDPLPDIRGIGGVAPRTGRLFTLPSVDSTIEYRALVVRAPGGRLVVLGQSLHDLQVATAAIARRLLFAGALVLVVGAGAVWVTVRRGLRPVDDMITTAAAIAAGDLTRRVAPADPASELGRLSASLNEMLTSIEKAFAAEARANERLKQFAADASHELRTPLATIAGYAELDRRGGLTDPAERRRAMARVESETRRMAVLVDDLMLLARLDLEQPLDLEMLDLSAVAADVVSDHLAIDTDHPLLLDAPAPVVIRGDAARLTQVLTNLLANLRTHTPAGTSATLQVGREGDEAVIRLTDTGPGFPPTALERAFDRFYRADRSRSRRSGGSGLGLAIVEAIVIAHRGTVSAANDGGAQITIKLPAGDHGEQILGEFSARRGIIPSDSRQAGA